MRCLPSELSYGMAACSAHLLRHPGRFRISRATNPPTSPVPMAPMTASAESIASTIVHIVWINIMNSGDFVHGVLGLRIYHSVSSSVSCYCMEIPLHVLITGYTPTYTPGSTCMYHVDCTLYALCRCCVGKSRVSGAGEAEARRLFLDLYSRKIQ